MTWSTSVRICKICQRPVIGNNNSPYCKQHGRMATIAKEVRAGLDTAYYKPDREKGLKDPLDLWMALSEESQVRFSFLIASFLMSYGGRRIGPVGAWELVFKLVREIEPPGG